MTEWMIGTAGWSIPSAVRDAFPPEGSHLARYATRLRAVEINSSFYRPHRRSTYARWAETVGTDFRFAVKLPKAISHAPPSDATAPAIERFTEEVLGLGDKLGVVLIQFPPGHAYDEAQARALFSAIGTALYCPLVCEPRHPSWFRDDVDQLFETMRIARVAADPAVVPGADRPGGWKGVRYRRLHGSPRIYYSDYPPAAIAAVRERIVSELAEGGESWCIFDNTALGAATANALELEADMRSKAESWR